MGSNRLERRLRSMCLDGLAVFFNKSKESFLNITLFQWR